VFKPQEASIMIMISQGKNSEGLHHKEDHSLLGMQISFMVIVFSVLILNIRLQIVGIIKEMFKQEVPMWLHVTLSVTNFIKPILIYSRGRVYCSNIMLYIGSMDETNSDRYTG
jgi:hypothetical protein